VPSACAIENVAATFIKASLANPLDGRRVGSPIVASGLVAFPQHPPKKHSWTV
jgi:hypothetical protein